jgi:hypothetical protein
LVDASMAADVAAAKVATVEHPVGGAGGFGCRCAGGRPVATVDRMECGLRGGYLPTPGADAWIGDMFDLSYCSASGSRGESQAGKGSKADERSAVNST